MAQALTDTVLAEKLLPQGGTALRVKQVALVLAGIAALAIAAKIRVPMWPSPVPITLGTFAVLTLAAAYGPRLGLATILGYMTLGALGFDVFASSSAQLNGITYMTGGTGGYLLGYVLATLALGFAARRGLDRSVLGMAGALLVGNALIYVPGVLWLNQFTGGWAQTLDWGLTPYLIGDAIKLGLAALLIPGLWKLVGRARG
ncbi:MAG: biotin transporter BioY [Rhodobacteraceae bacterium]|nr:biotin transporter BioY [Paracoccaceae bacterium]